MATEEEYEEWAARMMVSGNLQDDEEAIDAFQGRDTWRNYVTNKLQIPGTGGPTSGAIGALEEARNRLMDKFDEEGISLDPIQTDRGAIVRFRDNATGRFTSPSGAIAFLGRALRGRF